MRRIGQRLDLYTAGHAHHWGSVFAAGATKKLQYLSFGIFADDVAFRERIQKLVVGAEPHPLADREGLWLRSPDGVSLQLVVADKASPSRKSVPTALDPVPPGAGAAPGRSRVQPVRPRRLSHILLFTPDVLRMVAFGRDVLGLRLSDHSGDGIAFLHGLHGSDHHLVAFAKSHAPGLHHTSWDVGSANEVGLGSEQMRNAGYARGWGVGRHVLGSNYFYYVKDPWGSFAEYSFDIDFVPHDLDWPAPTARRRTRSRGRRRWRNSSKPGAGLTVQRAPRSAAQRAEGADAGGVARAVRPNSGRSHATRRTAR